MIALLGTPAPQQIDETFLSWPAQVISIAFTPDATGHVSQIFIDGSAVDGPAPAALNWQTAEGLGIGSTGAQIVAAWGEPDLRSPGDHGATFLNYRRRGMEFRIESDGRVSRVLVFAGGG